MLLYQLYLVGSQLTVPYGAVLTVGAYDKHNHWLIYPSYKQH